MDTRFRTRGGFSLVEMMVVVVIILILISILVPVVNLTMNRALLLSCAGNQKELGAALIAYTNQQKRYYPYRKGVRNNNYPDMLYETRGPSPFHPIAVSAGKVKAGSAFDDRAVLASYVKLEQFNDPLQPADVDYGSGSDGVDTNVWLGFQLWAGFGYNGYSGMYRYGDKLAWHGWDRHLGDRYEKSAQRDMVFDVILSCEDAFGDSIPINSDDPNRGVNRFWTGHQDSKGMLRELVLQNEAPPSDPGSGSSEEPTRYTLAGWIGEAPGGRGTIDKNVTHDDGSVETLAKLALDVRADPVVPTLDGTPEPRLQCPTYYKEGNQDVLAYVGGTYWYTILPERR